MVNDKELAELVARRIFETFDNPGDKCRRIQGRGGDRDKETDQGGLCEEALVNVIEKALTRYRSY